VKKNFFQNQKIYRLAGRSEAEPPEAIGFWRRTSHRGSEAIDFWRFERKI